MSFEKYYEQHKHGRGIREQVPESLQFCVNFEKALELGAGNLKESEFLAKKFEQVTAVDKEPVVVDFNEELKQSGTDNIECVVSSFDQLDFEKESFDYILAFQALPFYGKIGFEDFFKKVTSWLKPEGILCFTLWGDRHGWNTNKSSKPFFTDQLAFELIKNSNLEILSFNETEKIGSLVSPDVNFHTLHFVVKPRKKEEKV